MRSSLRSSRRRAQLDARPSVLSVFTGAGGLDLGLEAAGFQTVGCIELNDDARATITANRPEWKLVEHADVRKAAKLLRPSDFGLRRRQLGILAGGPPCQPFSKAAQWARSGRAGLSDPRSDSLRAFFRLAETFLPRVILIENVPGFAQGRTSAVHFISSSLRRINRKSGTRYKLDSRVLNAADYGVPQRRYRTLLIARRDGKTIDWPEPTHAHRPVRAYDAIGNLTPKKTRGASGTWAALLPTIPEGKNYLYHTAGGGGVQLFGKRRWFWSFLLKLSKDEPAWTLPASPGPATGPFHWSNRPLAPEEMLRLQTFPRRWRVAGGRTATVRQIGNATPPLLGEIIGRTLGSTMFGLKYNGRPRLRIKRVRTIPPATPPAPVPSAYLALEGAHSSHPGVGKGPAPVLKYHSLRTTQSYRRSSAHSAD